MSGKHQDDQKRPGLANMWSSHDPAGCLGVVGALVFALVLFVVSTWPFWVGVIIVAACLKFLFG